MYSWVFEFNIRVVGAEADDFLADVARTWPPVLESVPGTRGCLLLANAFALGGDFTYALRLDIERLSTLAALDAALKSDDGDWRRMRRTWLDVRTAVRGRVTQRIAGADRYCATTPGTEGAIHYVISHSGDQGATRANHAKYPALAHQRHRPLLGTGAASDETWLRLAGLESLDELPTGSDDLGSDRARLFGEIREVDGALFTGA